jgi:NhaP-type Na+/H+ or K+/H+ antiporter
MLVIVAVGATWLAGRLRIPSILFLMGIGLIVGPGFNLIDPDALFGEALTPAVSLAVGIILFEGGLGLRLREIEGQQRVIWLLVSVGVVITWMVGTAAAIVFTDLSVGAAFLLGSILVVSGPTVVGPILRSVRPSRSVASILKWESIFIDGIGAMVAVLTFDAVLVGLAGESALSITFEVFLFIVVGIAAGSLTALFAIAALRRHLVPEHLLSLFGIAAALVAFTASNAVIRDSGLIATTVLGLILANHRRIRTEQIIRFSEVVRVLLIGVLFIVLTARLTRDDLSTIGLGVVGLVAALVLIGRPLAVAVSTWRSDLSLDARRFLAGVAPRGIVAASVASVFALELEHAGYGGADGLVPLTFAVIMATVVIYGLGAGPLAKYLGLAQSKQQGVLIVGAGLVEYSIAGALHRSGIPVVMATTNRADEYRARMDGLDTFYGNILNDDVDLELELTGIGRLLALTPNDEVNTLACHQFADLFGGSETYQLAEGAQPPGIEVSRLGGRPLFASDLDYDRLHDELETGASVRRTNLTDTFTVDDLRADETVIRPAFVVKSDRLIVVTAGSANRVLGTLGAGDTLIWFAVPATEPA